MLGFSLVFIALGASASAVSGLLRSNLGILKGIAGLGIMVLGLHLAGVLSIPALLRERRFSKEPTEPGMIRAFVAGTVFCLWLDAVRRSDSGRYSGHSRNDRDAQSGSPPAGGVFAWPRPSRSCSRPPS